MFTMNPKKVRTRVWYGTFISMIEVLPRAEIKAAQGVAIYNLLSIVFRAIICCNSMVSVENSKREGINTPPLLNYFKKLI